MNAEAKTDPTRQARLPFRSITRRYYGVWGFYSFAPSFIFAIYPLFLRSRGLNQLQVNTVAATYFLVTFLTDVPTGASADAIDAAGFEGAKDRIFSRVAQIFRIGATVGALVGAYSARIDLAIPFLLG